MICDDCRYCVIGIEDDRLCAANDAGLIEIDPEEPILECEDYAELSSTSPCDGCDYKMDGEKCGMTFEPVKQYFRWDGKRMRCPNRYVRPRKPKKIEKQLQFDFNQE